MKAQKVTGKILSSDKASNYNTFENPDKIKLVNFDGARIDKKTGDLVLEIPAASIVTLEVE
jgi:alpha-N-arabinofuranosidase